MTVLVYPIVRLARESCVRRNETKPHHTTRAISMIGQYYNESMHHHRQCNNQKGSCELRRPPSVPLIYQHICVVCAITFHTLHSNQIIYHTSINIDKLTSSVYPTSSSTFRNVKVRNRLVLSTPSSNLKSV